ncbi:unnamed protein product [Soboliphyme baturini]|uniref:C2 domain-containing protein n=1 Tax=Soboliphyme baturini TaxID=241478 RepID=A0A183J8F5_9BILA|nr:unnamed protein product [Soboliphyme baturini]
MNKTVLFDGVDDAIRSKLSLMPDEEKKAEFKTAVVPGTSEPLFNQNFTFEVLPEDYHKRLIISVWHRDPVSRKSSLMGCMAFTVKSVLDEKVIFNNYQN